MNENKRLIALITLLFLLSVPVTLLAWGFALPCQYEESFLGELKYKCRRLDEAPGQRLVVLGGSAVAFGVDSALLEAQLSDYTPVNFGLYAALGTPVMMELSLPALREGDIVILCPEQQAQALSGYVGGEALWQGVDGAFSLLRRTSRRDWDALAGAFPRFAAGKLGCVLSGQAPSGEGVYCRASFDAQGDIVSPLCRSNRMPGLWDVNMPVSFRPGLASPEWIALTNDYIHTLQARGVQVWYHFCPMNAAAVAASEQEVEDYYDWLQGELDCPIAGDPRQCIMDAAWFFDTNFHLNASGKTVFTRQLLRDIKAMLADSSPTEIPLPQPPALSGAAAGTEAGDADCFTAELHDGFAVLTGLTAQGSARRTLTVPALWQGCPVRELPAQVLVSDVLEQVSVPQGIARIQDGAFAACPRLSAIVVEETDPSALSVGQGLLEGTAADVLVPASALTDYRLNYFWSLYSSRLSPAPEDVP